MLSRQATSAANPKSEYRNPKQTPRQINPKSENPKHRIGMKLVWNFTYFGHLRLFRISGFVLRIFALGIFARVTVFRSLIGFRISNTFGEELVSWSRSSPHNSQLIQLKKSPLPLFTKEELKSH
jgi:hypothetical protein